MAAKTKTVDLTTTVGLLSFVKVFRTTAGTKDDGSPSYEIQIIIPKTDRAGLKEIVKAIREVGEDKWGDNWKSVKSPLRDGDKEADEMTEDGTLKRDKYPERLGCYFMNARSGKPVAVVDRSVHPIVEESDLYSGCKGRISVNFYAYSTNGNHGIAAGLNGVQKISDGEPLAGGAPAPSSMFDMLDDEDDDLLDDEIEEEEEVEEAPAPKKRAAKKAPAKKPAPVEEDEDDDLLDEDDEDEEEPAPKKKAPAKKAPPRRKPAPVEVEEDEDDLLDDLDDEDA